MKKVTALVLAFAILFQVFGIVSFADAPEQYNGDVLMAVNTSFYENAKYTAHNVEPDIFYGGEYLSDESENTSEVQAPCFDIIDNVRPLSQKEADRIDAAKAKAGTDAVGKPVEYKIGDTKKVTSTDVDKDVTVKCIYIGTSCTVWKQVEECADDPLSDEQCIELEKWFEDIIPVELELFGDRRIDTDGDGKIAIFFHEMKDSYAGYVDYSDFIDSDGKTDSVYMRQNESSPHCDCIHVSVSTEYGYAHTVMIHEYQHYIHYSYGFVGKTNATYFKAASAVTEGFSSAAEYILLGYWRYYFNDSQIESLYYFQFPESYGLEFVFFQYVRTRYAQLTGDAEGEYPGKNVYRAILERMDAKGHDGFRVAADLLYPQQEYPGLKSADDRLKQLVVDFWSAALLKEKTGIHGFNGEPVAEYVNIYVSDFDNDEEITVCPGMADFRRISIGSCSEAVVDKADKNIVFIAFDGLYNHLYYDADCQETKTLVQSVGKNEWFYTPYFRRDNSVLFPGRSFKYWEYEGVKYTEDEIITSDGDVTIHGVTEAAEPVGIGSYNFDYPEYKYKCFAFTPVTSNYYKLCYGDYLFVCNANSVYSCITEAAYHEERNSAVYWFEAGETYHIYCKVYDTDWAEEDEDYYTLDIVVQEAHYKLTCDYRGVNGRKNIVYDGYDSYYLPTGSLYFDALKTGKMLLGWSKDQNATEACYESGDYLDIQEDTTVYAVWDDIDEIKEGTSFVPIHPYKRFKFLGWSTVKNASEPEYQAGDEIFSFDDVTLYAVYENTSEKIELTAIEKLLVIPRLSRWFFRCLAFAIKNISGAMNGTFLVSTDTEMGSV